MSIHANNLILILLALQFTSCAGQVKENTISDIKDSVDITQPVIHDQNTVFPQIHTNLNGMVSEFVRTIYQDKKGNYWFGTNGDGIIRYDGKKLEKISIVGIGSHFRVLEIVEDLTGNLWFGTSEGLLKYNGQTFITFSKGEGYQNEEIWGLTIDNNGLIWVGSTGGVSQFGGKKFVPFNLPDVRVDEPKAMLSHDLVFKIMQDRNGAMWFVTDGNGIFKYYNGKFEHLTTKNGLADNNAADILEDSRGNIWIGTFYGGVSKFDGKAYTNYTQDGVIAGEEAYNLYEDSRGIFGLRRKGMVFIDMMVVISYSIPLRMV